MDLKMYKLQSQAGSPVPPKNDSPGVREVHLILERKCTTLNVKFPGHSERGNPHSQTMYAPP